MTIKQRLLNYIYTLLGDLIMNNRFNMILNSIEALTTVDWNLLLEDTEFRKLFFQLIGDKNNDDKAVISQSVEYVNNNY